MKNVNRNLGNGEVIGGCHDKPDVRSLVRAVATARACGEGMEGSGGTCWPRRCLNGLPTHSFTRRPNSSASARPKRLEPVSKGLICLICACNWGLVFFSLLLLLLPLLPLLLSLVPAFSLPLPATATTGVLDVSMLLSELSVVSCSMAEVTPAPLSTLAPLAGELGWPISPPFPPPTLVPPPATVAAAEVGNNFSISALPN